MDREIILNAWELVNKDYKIKKFYFIPGIFSIIFLTIILVYQFIYTYIVLFNKSLEAFEILLSVFHSWYIVELVIIWIILILVYILFIPTTEWALIWYISEKKTLDTEVSISESIWSGIYRLLPMFEYWNIFSQFKFISVLNIYLFTLRFVGIEYLSLINYIFLFLLFISTIVNVLFAYSKFEIVLNNKTSLEAISRSVKISTLSLGMTIKIYFFLFLINMRIIFNFIVFLFFPILIAMAIIYISSKIFLFLTISILVVLFLLMILFLWYLWWVFEIFKLSVWYYAYVIWSRRLSRIEKDEDDD